MSWTKFYDFKEVLEIKHFAHEDGRARDWKCKFNGKMLKFQRRDGCFLKQNGPLDTHDCGIYWLRVEQTCHGHPSGLWEYIGLSKNRSGSEYQRGIFGRLADHIRKIQYLPHRSKFGYRLYNKEYDDGKSDKQIQNERLLRTEKRLSTPLRNRYLNEFHGNDFPNCQAFRDHFRTKDGRDLIVKDCGSEFAEFFNINKGELQTFSDIKTFMETKIQIKFFVIPKMTKGKDKLYIEIAEAMCLDAYKKNHEGFLPKLNITNEPKKLPWNGGDKFRDQDIQHVEKEINILNGFS